MLREECDKIQFVKIVIDLGGSHSILSDPNQPKLVIPCDGIEINMQLHSLPLVTASVLIDDLNITVNRNREILSCEAGFEMVEWQISEIQTTGSLIV